MNSSQSLRIGKRVTAPALNRALDGLIIDKSESMSPEMRINETA